MGQENSIMNYKPVMVSSMFITMMFWRCLKQAYAIIFEKNLKNEKTSFERIWFDFLWVIYYNISWVVLFHEISTLDETNYEKNKSID